VIGLVTRRGAHSVTETVAALAREIERRGATVVAVIDHAAAAEAAGLAMPATQVIVFGNPQAGTPLMQAVPEIAIDLPLRIMVYDDGQPGSIVSWQDPAYVAQRFGLPDAPAALAAPAAIADAALDAAQ
jgi:uncharacterized protein (DUF302 family)